MSMSLLKIKDHLEKFEERKNNNSWSYLGNNFFLPLYILKKNIKKIQFFAWPWIIKEQKLSIPFLLKYVNKMLPFWEYVFLYQKVNKKLIDTYVKKGIAMKNLENPSLNTENKFPDYFIEKYIIPKGNWDKIFAYPISKKFIDKYSNNIISWDNISMHPLSLKFIEKHKDKLNWNFLLNSNRKLFSPKFIDNYADYVDWNLLFRYKRTIPVKILEKHLDKFQSNNLFCLQNLSKRFVKKHLKMLDIKYQGIISICKNFKESQYIIRNYNEINKYAEDADFETDWLLQEIIEHNYVNALQMFLESQEYNAEWNTHYLEGDETFLQEAVRKSSIKIIDLIITQCLPDSIVNECGCEEKRTPLNLAIERGDQKIVNLLKNYGAK